MLEKNMAEIRDVMSTKVIQINEDDSAFFILKMFERCKISGAPVVNSKGECTGVLSKTDFMSSKLIEQLDGGVPFDRITVKNLMTFCQPVTVEPIASIEKTAHMMVDLDIHRIFVRDEHGIIVGIASSLDILKAIRKKNRNPQLENKMSQMLHRTNRTYSATSSASRAWT